MPQTIPPFDVNNRPHEAELIKALRLQHMIVTQVASSSPCCIFNIENFFPTELAAAMVEARWTRQEGVSYPSHCDGMIQYFIEAVIPDPIFAVIEVDPTNNTAQLEFSGY